MEAWMEVVEPLGVSVEALSEAQMELAKDVLVACVAGRWGESLVD